MNRTITLLILCTALLLPLGVTAQTLDGSPYTPGKDANIDLYLCGWQESPARTVRGSLVVQDILTKGNRLDPPKKGAVLELANTFSHGILPVGETTETTTFTGEQEVYYILSGTGVLQAGRRKADLKANIVVLVPARLKFTIQNTGADPLCMYIINEPTPDGFKPQNRFVVKDENTTPISGTTGHWNHIVKGLLGQDDGLATVARVITVQIDPMTMPHPHSHGNGTEEVWTSISGTSVAFIGKQIRWQKPGWGYMVPPNGNTPHSNINEGTETVKMLYFTSHD